MIAFTSVVLGLGMVLGLWYCFYPIIVCFGTVSHCMNLYAFKVVPMAVGSEQQILSIFKVQHRQRCLSVISGLFLDG